ncbi:MAG: signal recognition particle subunit SRP19/SEC65 family protein [Rhodopseudomonas palustris]|nr:signal recognition particle subunit SRP19/SEC65 family protein [Rhodopseudomonas palustris]
MDVRFHPVEVCPDKRGEINLVDYPDRAVPEHHRVLVYHIISFRGTHNNNPLFCPEAEIGRADHIAHILDKEDINIIERQVVDRVFYQVGIKMTFLAGICIERRDTQRHNPLEIIVPIHIAGNCTCTQPLFLSSGTRRSMSAVFPEPIAPSRSNARTPCVFQMLCILVSKSVVDVVNILLNPDVDMMHTHRYERTVYTLTHKLSCNGSKASAYCIPATSMRRIHVVEGRRVSRNLAAKAPVITDLERALKRAGVTFRIEEHHHPAHWMRQEGRIVAEWTGRQRGTHQKSCPET